MNFESWRDRARDLLTREIPPESAQWSQSETQTEFFAPADDTAAPGDARSLVPREFVEQAEWVAAFRADDTAGLLYRILWRLLKEDRNLLSITIDPDTREFHSRFRQVTRDCHKMKAFVRFRERDGHFVAWHEPDHFIVPLVAPFFARRFAGMKWSILTPDASAHWDGEKLEIGEGCPKSAAPTVDQAEDLWTAYYKAIFNPARIKLRAMKKELPVRHWKNLPEAKAIGELLREAPSRLEHFAKNQPFAGAEAFLPQGGERSLKRLSEAARDCRGCNLCEVGSQTVFGEGSPDSRVVFVGEQPGDKEDLAGKPFIGPAGQLLDRALLEAGIDRTKVYVTNAVKHFKFERKGKIRLHMKPNSSEIAACRPWLRSELELIRPDLLICLGLTAAQSVLGKSVTLKAVNGKVLKTTYCDRTVVITHPSALLRIPDPELKLTAYRDYVQELRKIAGLMEESETSGTH